MLLGSTPRIRQVKGLTAVQMIAIKAFLQGAVYGRLNSQPDKTFAARDLVGGLGRDWTSTPLQALYDKEVAHGKNDHEAWTQAGIDVGYILKAVLHDDKRSFDPLTVPPNVKAYRWVTPAAVVAVGTEVSEARVDEFLDRIVVDPNVMTGKPVIRGTRVPVELVVRMVAQRVPEEEILRDYPRLQPADIQAALMYAANIVVHEDVFPTFISE